MDKVTKPRFEIGKTYYFLLINYLSGKSASVIFDGDTITGVKLISLTCQSKHNVPVFFSDTKRETGYIFIDDQGNEYHNQYPEFDAISIGSTPDMYVNSTKETGGVLYCSLSRMLEELYASMHTDDPMWTPTYHLLDLLLNEMTKHGLSYLRHMVGNPELNIGWVEITELEKESI